MNTFALLFLIFALTTSAVAFKNDVCGLKHSMDGIGNFSCDGYFEKWSYKADTNECVQFIYGGCAGNDNRFDTPDECENICKE